MEDDPMTFEVDLRSITVEVFQEVDALLAEIEREREQGSTFHTGGIVHPSDVRVNLNADSVLPRHVVESWGASTASTSPQTSGPIILETRWMPPSYEELIARDRALVRRDRATARQVAERLEITSTKES